MTRAVSSGLPPGIDPIPVAVPRPHGKPLSATLLSLAAAARFSRDAGATAARWGPVAA